MSERSHDALWRLASRLRDLPARFRRRLLARRCGYTFAPGALIHRDAVFDTRYGGVLTVADRVEICQGALLAPHGGSIEIEERVYIGPYCVIYGHGGLKIGADTLMAAQTVVIPANHTFASRGKKIREQPVTAAGITIGADVWLGAGVKILDGVSIGAGCVIGAGSVVTQSLEPCTVAAGVPARPLKARP